MSYSHPVRGEEIMPVAEIAASITSLRATMDIAKAMMMGDYIDSEMQKFTVTFENMST